jgi:4-aminobutyrate aminotransferase/4-aminobutyrate aminotransferase/(S)-3-amino-2-methylpropionate transaminase
VFLAEMRPLVDEVEQVGDARAAGALAALEFVQDKATIRPAPGFQLAVYHAALRRGVLGITQRGKWHLRLQPALTMPEAVFRDSCQRLADAVREVAADPPDESERLLDAVAGSAR